MEKTHASDVKILMLFGLSLIALTTLVLFLSGLNRSPNNDFFNDGGVFFINYILSMAFFIIILAVHRPFFKFKQIDRRLYIIAVILFSISCFTLNHAIVLFAQFSNWVIVYLCIFYAAFIGFCFIEKLNRFIRLAIFFCLGSGLVMVIYFAIYLAPLSPIAIVGFFLLGLSLHLLVPLISAISVIVNYIKVKKTNIEKISFFLGIILPLIIAAVFLIRWNNFKQEIHVASSSIITRPDNTLPEWILICQNMPSDDFSQKIIKGNLVYDSFNNMWGGWGVGSFDEVKKHDPLVNMGMALLGDINLDRDTKVKILKSQFDARHLTQRKLWSGKDIGTIDVLNNIKVFPDFRLAYTEKTITVKNFANWENSREEAAFTFYLPEGSVATSLSLWIDGKEEKSRLTTKEKADSAYVKIVGVENRDPALMHWQEGNTLTVTIFPCTPKENRRFKIGITTPLEKDGTILKLQNTYFDGPVSKNILETTRIAFESDSKIEGIKVPDDFKKQLDNSYLYTGSYIPYWEIESTVTPLSSKAFCFNNYSYYLTELTKEKQKIDLQEVYLDVNKSWTRQEFEQVVEAAKGIKIWVHHDKLIAVDSENKDEVFGLLSKKNFSLFPFNDITDPNKSLVVTKSTPLSPNLADLEGSQFLDQLIKGITDKNQRINLFQLGNTKSPYLKSLKEFQLFNFNSGEIEDLDNLLLKREVTVSNEDSNEVALDISGVTIHKSPELKTSDAPDHLLRLFAYNGIMKELGRNYFNKNADYIDKLAGIANEAYVVSPVSSLIVLESKKDYERFDIKENENSLKNATVNSSGAVPEPAEWLLILLFISLLVVLFLKRDKLFKVSWF